ncbi:hypothetical protein D3C75_784720 [compost metagenome]
MDDLLHLLRDISVSRFPFFSEYVGHRLHNFSHEPVFDFGNRFQFKQLLKQFFVLRSQRQAFSGALHLPDHVGKQTEQHHLVFSVEHVFTQRGMQKFA